MDSLNEKINKIENIEIESYQNIYGIDSADSRKAKWMPLFHGIRFDVLNKLESIFINKAIIPSYCVPSNYIGMDQEVHYLYFSDDIENCNKGKYISLMPYIPESLEFDTFIRENLYFVVNGYHEAFKTHYLTYDEYTKVIESGRKLNNIYSYAHDEYLSKKPILLDEIISINIDSSKFRISKEIIEKIIKLMEFYHVNFPFIDTFNNTVLYEFNNKDYYRRI